MILAQVSDSSHSDVSSHLVAKKGASASFVLRRLDGF